MRPHANHATQIVEDIDSDTFLVPPFIGLEGYAKEMQDFWRFAK